MTGLDLAADCDRCFGLCCVVPAFRAVDGFGTDKASGEPCSNLDAGDRCRIHARLTDSGWPGCVAFDCHGAGQHVAQVTYGGVSWRDRDEPYVRAEMGAVLTVVRVLHQMLLRLGPADPAYAEIVALREGGPESLLTLDLDALEDRVETAVAQRERRQTTTD